VFVTAADALIECRADELRACRQALADTQEALRRLTNLVAELGIAPGDVDGARLVLRRYGAEA
jgi:hypothetical protein